MQSRRALRLMLVAGAAAVVAACGGGDADPPKAAPSYSRVVAFGDSLSDVGSYATPGLLAATGGQGGRYTVNGPSGRNWVEVLAASWLGVAPPCAAEVGMDPPAGSPFLAFSAATVTRPGCTGYAQGGARVTDPIGVQNRALGLPNGAFGQLTKPVTAQMDAHLATSGGRFAANEVVTVLAGANDLFIQLGRAQGGATDVGVQMVTAAAQLAGLVKSKLVANGAKRVIVLNVSDVSATPFGLAQSAQSQAQIQQLVVAFNERLKADLAGTEGVLFVDLFARIKALSSNPASAAAVGLTNLTAPACNLQTAPSSLICNANTLAAANVSGYAFADTVHPSPRAYALIAGIVAEEMAKAGWL